MELKFDPNKPEYVLVDSEEKLQKALEELDKEKVIGVDVETTGLDPYTSKLLTVQIGTYTKTFILDTRKMNLRDHPGLKSLLEDKKHVKLMHNGKFDYKQIKHHLNISTDNIYDTMLTEAVLTAGLGSGYYSFQALIEKYTGIHIEKDIRREFLGMKKAAFTDDQLRYCALDTLYLFPVFEKQFPQLKKEGLVNIAKLEFASTRVVGDMELRGLFIDAKRWRKIIDDLRIKRDQHAEDFYEFVRPNYQTAQVDLFGKMAPPLNINSNAQLLDLFNNKLGLNLPSTGDGILSVVNHPVAKKLREYRGYEKLISSFGDSLLEKINPVTKRLHPEFNQMGTATGRFSCNNPNLQQIPRNSEEAPFRECFNPSPGYKLVVSDYSSFEMRILAELSGDEKMVHALREGYDLHSYTASLMFNVPYSDDFKKKYPDLRQIAKPIGFGLMYGMGYMGLAGRLEVSPDEGKDYMDKYFASYPSVQKFLDKLAKDAVRLGWSSTPAGRKRWYKKPDKTDPDYKRKISSIQRQAKNHPIQGTNADAVKIALVFVSDRMKKDGIDGGITHTVHDEIVCEVREDQAEDFAKILSDEMVRAAQLYIKNVPVRSDPFVGDVWEH